MVFRVALLSLIAFVLLGAKGISIAPTPFSDGYGAGTSFPYRPRNTTFYDCDFGGTIDEPVLAYNFNSVDRSTGGYNYYETSTLSEMYGSSVSSQETRCKQLGGGGPPYCGVLQNSGGPINGSRYYDLTTTANASGTDHTGFKKAEDATAEDYSQENAYTISVWVKIDSRSSPGTYVASKDYEFVFTGNPDGTDDELCMDVTGITETAGATTCAWLSGTDMGAWEAEGNWVHLVSKYDGGTDYEVWVDGTKVYTAAVSGTITNQAQNLEIGAANTWGFNGGIDEFAIFDYALSDAQIALMGACVIPK